ncbi:TraB/GumN family protein [Lysobacter sp. SG-8]|uniref:TraB/GumN family protein n=1 Tax=Marilutibacter penaei TaxID=2759900 RepID=A0A7W3U348_9GAMM|nr:TraB/GumN family protein [Lysobacter penaei]MBB1088029.1 TraB/GumN family protein [Lysobacter penaei]
MKRSMRICAALVLLAGVCGPLDAQEAGDDAGPVRDLETLVVSGVQPGPGLWKVSTGSGHVMWVLGTVSPLPRRMEWEAREVGGVIAGAQEVMLAPGIDIDADVGFFGGLALAPRLMRARRSPDGRRLEEVLSPGEYARWSTLKRQYIGGDRGIEKWRPMFAAARLYQEAVEDVGLRTRGVVTPVVEDLARDHGVTVSRPMVELKIEDPKAAISEFSAAEIDDLACFSKTLDRVQDDLGYMRERANAWAVGDIEGLRSIPFQPFEDCEQAWASVQALSDRVGDLRAQRDALWLKEVDRVLANNRVTLALLPMEELFRPDGLAASLQARGYRVEAPGEYDAASPMDAPTPDDGVAPPAG